MRRAITELRRAFVVASTVFGATVSAAPLLHSMFQDHAVLQRDRPVRVWGTAAAGQEITVSFAGQSRHASAGTDGRWQLQLDPLPAGGPHILEAVTAGGDRQTLRDVLVGDVWLCSGQSNMVLPVHRALDSRSEIANSANDRIRLLTIPLASDVTPQDEFIRGGEWQVAGPATVPEFSAACLYFARELQKSVDVPFGLIASAWGGSRIEAWMSAPALRAAGGYDAMLDAVELRRSDPAAATRRWASIWESWWHNQPATRGQRDPWATTATTSQWQAAPADLVPWEQWQVPALRNYNGMLWYRTTVQVSKQQSQRRARLSLGNVDEADLTWVNAQLQGATDGDTQGFAPLPSGSNRVYYLSPGTLRAGDNALVVNVLDTYALGGLYGPAQSRVLQFDDGSAIPLDGAWRYQIPPAVGTPPREPWGSTAGLGTIRNAMIAPLANYTLRGVAWYQGESNTEDASRYRDLLTRFMSNWRREFDSPQLPFLIVQLANYGAPPTRPVESGWAELREAQRQAVAADPHAALVVTIDIGDRYDIHPANKQELGRRLARAAQHEVYGEPVAPSGPRATAARREGADVVIDFADVAGHLVAYGAEAPIGFELCAAARDSCRFAPARIDGDRIVLAATPQATRVRYCWADSPVCTLFDESSLPAGPFELSIEARDKRFQ
ncbi:MAG TPA: sialate O-acetylesterase [Povalibacter sp.]|uniref:sialate O-acetylesterase n=1 Tax=Povalibacter sp. TaxID=1962978 RepID=UPI002B881D7C|nr:sialate O-acetylesterase [Povalibacter sp.]HMN46172.1 sialate O-acetylesterase [Povalibacter sp.]